MPKYKNRLNVRVEAISFNHGIRLYEVHDYLPDFFRNLQTVDMDAAMTAPVKLFYPFSQTRRVEAGATFATYYHRLDQFNDFMILSGFMEKCKCYSTFISLISTINPCKTSACAYFYCLSIFLIGTGGLNKKGAFPEV